MTMTLTITHSAFSTPSATLLAEQGDVTLIRSSAQEADINWGRATSSAVLNRDTAAATNKRLMRERFAQAGVPMPRLFTADQVANEETAPAIIGRPDRHSKGRGMWLITDGASLTRALAGTRRKRAATHFMEYISEERAPREYRVHIFLGRSIRISRKDWEAEDRTWRAVRPGDMDMRKVRQAAKDAVAALGLDFGAVDILAGGTNNEDVWVLEVNTAPGLGGSMPRVYHEAFTTWKEQQS
jgi:glutathione synthase/RimK-type ligase-like ATP-grasp enzyme